MSKLKYKVGDRVLIKNIDWYNENMDEYGYVNCPPYTFFAAMCQYCGKICTIKHVDNFDKKYKMTEDDCYWNWTDEMIECKVEDRDMDNIWEDEFGLGEGYYKTEPTGNGRYPSQIQWFTFLELVKDMRSEQKDIRTMFDFKTEEEFDTWAEDSYERQVKLEHKVDNMIKTLFD